MRTIKIFSLMLLTALGISCARIEPVETQTGLTLKLDSGLMQTRADGDTAPAFETKIDHFDFFFFSDEAGTQPIPGMHGRAEGSTKVLDTTDGGLYAALRYNTSYVYILANYPEEINQNDDWTLERLLALPVDAKIVKRKITAINPVTNKPEETGAVEFCSELVMDSYNPTTEKYTVRLTPQEENENRTVNVGLTRLAAKLTLELTLTGSVNGTEPGEVWKPVRKDLKAYYVNALNNRSTVAATPVHRADLTWSMDGQDKDAAGNIYEYLTYPTPYPMTPDPKPIGMDDNEHYIFTTNAVYTYPQTWTGDEDNAEPYFKVAMPWYSNVRGSANFYYKIVIPKPAGNTFTLERNCWYKAKARLSVIDTADEYITIVADYTVEPWAESGWTGGPDLNAARFFNVPVTTYDLYGEESVSVPFSSSSTVKVFFTEFEYTNYKEGLGVTYTFPYTEADNKTSLTLPTRYNGQTISPAIAQDKNQYSLTVVGKTVNFSHALSNIYTVRHIKFVIKNAEGAKATVIINQHPAIEVKTLPTNNYFVNGHFARATEGIHVPGHPETKVGVAFELQRTEAGQTRYHSDDWRFDDVPSSSDLHTQYYWYPGAAGYGSSTSWGESPRVQRSPENGRYGYIVADGVKQTPYLVVVSVSAFNENNNTYTYRECTSSDPHNHDGPITAPKKFILGDPRVIGGSTLFGELANVSGSGNKGGYLYQPSTVRNSNGTTTVGDAVYKPWTEPEKILTSSNADSDHQVIGPRLLLSSYYNGQNASVGYDEARKRAATYQEAGYPAGRWRLPTEAEIMFMVARQQEGVLPAVWAEGSNYWVADGRFVHINSGSGAVVEFHPAVSSYVNRFVYDLWYWGDDPMEDQEQYWPDMHLVNPNNN